MALSIDWRDSTDHYHQQLLQSPATQISDTFSCNLTLATISATSAGLYTCNAAITGISGGRVGFINLQVQRFGHEHACKELDAHY